MTQLHIAVALQSSNIYIIPTYHEKISQPSFLQFIYLFLPRYSVASFATYLLFLVALVNQLVKIQQLELLEPLYLVLGVPSEPLCLHTQSLATAHSSNKQQPCFFFQFKSLNKHKTNKYIQNYNRNLYKLNLAKTIIYKKLLLITFSVLQLCKTFSQLFHSIRISVTDLICNEIHNNFSKTTVTNSYQVTNKN
eukprot:TRINITY_DN19201_c0_g1_i8.p2 TRINITY_DN19201_c0_g1~~TRINITY_DN19201_c0_g1_i8.p2  ORF type:complete len:193 (-),score=-19.92 TRINITY_DN19201_c0_g1_i8:367-945(-)